MKAKEINSNLSKKRNFSEIAKDDLEIEQTEDEKNEELFKKIIVQNEQSVLVSSPTSSLSPLTTIIETPTTIEQLKQLHHVQVVNIVEKVVSIKARKAVEKEFDVKLNDYPFNALDGNHLYNAIVAYKANLQSNGTVESGKQKIVENLMANSKVIDESIAESISNWLYDTFIEKPEVFSDDKTLNTFFEKVLNVDLNSVDKDLESVIQKSLKQLVYSFGCDFPLVGREDSIAQIESCFSQYYDKISANAKLDKQNFSIAVIAAAPGVGKSKLLSYFGLLQWKNGFFPLFVSFGNGTLHGNIEEEINIETSLSLRMIFSVYCRLVEKQISFATFVRKWIAYFRSTTVDVELTLIFLNNLLSKLFETNFKQFYIVVDEIHQIDNGAMDKTNPLREILANIGKYMQTPQYILLPLIAGTYYTVIHSHFIGSTYKSQFIPLKAFLLHDQQIELLNALSMKKNVNEEIMYRKLENWRTNRDFCHFLRTFGGFPRGVEYFLADYLQNETRNTFTSWTLASENLKNTYSLAINNSFVRTIITTVITQQIVNRYDLVLDNFNTTWSELENKGIVLLQPISNDINSSHAIVYYPPVLLDQLFAALKNTDLVGFFKRVFLQNSDIYWQNWENIIHVYIYLIFSLLAGKRNITLKQVFPNSKMNISSSDTTISEIFEKTSIFESSSTQLHSKISHIQNLQQFNEVFDKTELKQVNLFEEQIFVVKNGNGASARDILLFGLESGQKEKLVFHYQCKWSDAQDGIISYSQIKSEIVKNKTLQIDNTSVRNITIIICGTMISGLPEQLPDDLIIVCKENFDSFFGVFSDAMKSTCTQQFVRINELTEKELQHFVGIEESSARQIIEKRGPEGFLNMKDLKNKLDSNSYNYLMYGTNKKDQIKNEKIRTLLL